MHKDGRKREKTPFARRAGKTHKTPSLVWEHASKQKTRKTSISFAIQLMHPAAKSRKRYFCVCVALIRRREEKSPSSGYHQQQPKDSRLCHIHFPRLVISESTLETGSRVRILDSKLAASEVERPAVICVVGHGYPTAVSVCIRKERARVEPLVVHERLAMASRVRLIQAGACVALRAERAGG